MRDTWLLLNDDPDPAAERDGAVAPRNETIAEAIAGAAVPRAEPGADGSGRLATPKYWDFLLGTD